MPFEKALKVLEMNLRTIAQAPVSHNIGVDCIFARYLSYTLMIDFHFNDSKESAVLAPYQVFFESDIMPFQKASSEALVMNEYRIPFGPAINLPPIIPHQVKP